MKCVCGGGGERGRKVMSSGLPLYHVVNRSCSVSIQAKQLLAAGLPSKKS